MSSRRWNREEVLVALNIYCRTPFGRLHARNSEIIQVAELLERTANSLAMKCCNLAGFDPTLQARGVKGLSKASRLDREVWEAFEVDPDAISFESEKEYARITQKPVREAKGVTWEDVDGLDVEAVTRVRVNQRFFRSLILSGYDEKCAVCLLPIRALLVASHIVPWSLDRENRMNPRNGLCLCAIHDRAFDKGFIGVSDQYTIALSNRLDKFRDEPAVRDSIIRFEGHTIHLPDRWHPDQQLLRRHRELTM